MRTTAAALVTLLPLALFGANLHPSVATLIQKSVEANEHDWQAAPGFDYFETDRTDNGTRTFESLMIQGSPYQRLFAVDGVPVSAEVQRAEQKKFMRTIRERESESVSQRERRISKYRKERERDHLLIEQLARAFQFRYEGEQKIDDHETYLLAATPLASYRPPNLESRVLTGMTGRLWVDKKTFQWVKVEARVIHPVEIEGFLAQVEPGTRFELDYTMVAPGVWLPKHFSVHSNSRILLMFSRRKDEDDTYFDYHRNSG